MMISQKRSKIHKKIILNKKKIVDNNKQQGVGPARNLERKRKVNF